MTGAAGGTEVTVETGPEGVELVVSKVVLSPKLGGGLRRMYWTGPDVEHPGASRWSEDRRQAARFGTIDEVAAGLSTLVSRYRIAAFQRCLW